MSGGQLFFYTAGSSTPQNTYTTSAGNVANANPVVLDSGGYPAASGAVVEIWFTAGVNYKAVLKTAAGVTVWTRDNLVGINDATNAASEWIAGPTPTYIGATSFSLVGDQTGTFQIGRRVKTTNTGGTIYSTISNSVFGAVTTVTVVNDSGTLDSGLSAVSYGLLSASNTAIPTNISGGGYGQIRFPATQNASTNANTLDDYEEGTWTPSVGGSATYTSQVGTYVKVGKWVTVQGHLVINALGTGSTTTISGLPFTASSVFGQIQTGCVSYFSALAVNVLFFAPYILNNTTTLRFVNLNAAGAASVLDPAVFGNAAEVNFSITYEATA